MFLYKVYLVAKIEASPEENACPVNVSDFCVGMEELVCRLSLWKMEFFKYMKVCQGVPGSQGTIIPA
jgi:hypothetical protein